MFGRQNLLTSAALEAAGPCSVAMFMSFELRKQDKIDLNNQLKFKENNEYSH